MRETARNNEDGSRSSHLMAWKGDTTKKRGDYGVYPTIAPKEGKETSTKSSDWKTQDAKEASARGEMVKVKTARKAEKLAAGSWKKGQDKKEAMKEYRSNKKAKKNNSDYEQPMSDITIDKFNAKKRM